MKLLPLFLREQLQPVLWLSVGSMLLAAWSMGLFAHSLALTEGQDARLSLASWLLRLLIVTFWIIWLNAALARERHERFDQVLFSLPLSRFNLLSQRLLSWMLTSVVIALFSGLMLTAAGADPEAALKWSLSFALELWLVSALVLFIASNLAQPSLAMLMTLLFYLFLRLIAYAAALAQHAVNENNMPWLAQIIQQGLALLSSLLPPLHQFAASSWFMQPPDWSVLGTQALHTLLFLLLLLFAAGHDFNKRALS